MSLKPFCENSVRSSWIKRFGVNHPDRFVSHNGRMGKV